ncbi:YdiK family protein [Bacillus sp. Marseille-P3661]|uniref:YdiK family protein n=1 Tax=Bacillus sp. Marseille-P3661 TaxID=1936234 RepID=UPI000C828E6B|nr:YdiK family protein [Bacillus sp. Marseille-P3661]
MKTTPYTMGLIYAAMGGLFTFLAVESVEETIWNLTTVLLMLVATFDFSAAIRFFTVKSRLQSKK